MVGKAFRVGINILTYMDHVHTRRGLAATLLPRWGGGLVVKIEMGTGLSQMK